MRTYALSALVLVVAASTLYGVIHASKSESLVQVIQQAQITTPKITRNLIIHDKKSPLKDQFGMGQRQGYSKRQIILGG